MNLFDRDNQITWKVVQWLAKHDTYSYASMWKIIITELEKHPSYDFMDGIKCTRCYTYGGERLERRLHHMVRREITLANIKKRYYNHNNNNSNNNKCVDDLFIK